MSVRFPTLKYGNPFDLDTRKQLVLILSNIFRNIRNHQKSPWPFWQTSSFYCLVDHGFGPILLSHPDDTGWVQGEEGTDHSHCVLLQKHSHIHKRNKETKTWSLKHWQRETPLSNTAVQLQELTDLERFVQEMRPAASDRNMGPRRSREDNFIQYIHHIWAIWSCICNIHILYYIILYYIILLVVTSIINYYHHYYLYIQAHMTMVCSIVSVFGAPKCEHRYVQWRIKDIAPPPRKHWSSSFRSSWAALSIRSMDSWQSCRPSAQITCIGPALWPWMSWLKSCQKSGRRQWMTWD